MNGFSAADMTDARAKGYKDRIEFEKEQEPIGYRWRHSAGEPWQYSSVPCGWEHQPLYAAPVAAAPVCGDCSTPLLYECTGCSATNYPPRTPAAPGIDLEALIAVRNQLHQMSAAKDLGEGWADVVIELMGDVQKVIDASPKGGSVDNVTRAAFQRWAVSQNLSVTRSEVHIGMGGDYVDRATSHAWEAWQAARQPTSAEVGA